MVVSDQRCRPEIWLSIYQDQFWAKPFRILKAFPSFLLCSKKTRAKVEEKVEQRRKSIVSKFSLELFSILSFVFLGSCPLRTPKTFGKYCCRVYSSFRYSSLRSTLWPLLYVVHLLFLSWQILLTNLIISLCKIS